MTATEPARSRLRRLRPRRARETTAVAVAYVTGMFMSAMDMHVVNVALPTLSRDFAEPLASIQWTILAYLLTLALLIPASGWIGDRIGTKRTFLIALATFTIASALCGAARNLPELIAARALQGLGGGMLTPMGTAMLFRAFPPERRAVVARTLILPVLIGPGAAPLLGGFFTQQLSWRWVFFVNVPIGAVMLVFSMLFLSEYRAPPHGRLDIVGLLLSGLGLSALMYAISEGSTDGWGSARIVATGVGGLIALALFARLSLRRPEPLLRLRLLGDRLFRATNVTGAFGIGSFLSFLYLAPIFLQEVLGLSPIASGATTFVEAVGVVLASQSLGRLYPRLGPRVLAGCSMAALAIVMALFWLVTPGTNVWWVRAAMFASGVCNSGTVLSVQSAMFTSITREDTAHASAIYNTGRQASIAVSIAVVTTVVAGVGGVGAGAATAFHAAFLAAAGLALLGALSAFALIRTDDARVTMRP